MTPVGTASLVPGVPSPVLSSAAPEPRSRRSFRLNPTDANTYYPSVFGGNGAVASEHYLAATAGIDMMKAGGTAVDAAVSAALVEGVVNPQMHTIGGEIPMLIAVPGAKRPICINGNMVAPERATPAAFLERGFDKIPPEGVLAAGVPAAMGALLEALIRFGRLSFADVAAPAVALAKNGFPVHSGLVRQHKFGILDNAEKFRRQWPGSAAVYLPHGAPPEEGTLLKNKALAGVYEHLAHAEATAGGDRRRGLEAAFSAFYRGEIADQIVAFVAARHGLLQRSDFDRFTVPVESGSSIFFAGAEIFKCGPWTQGPALLQTLSILKNQSLAELKHNSAAYIHAVVEALKLAFADRDQFYGDPRQVDVPLSALLSDQYGEMRSALIHEGASAELRPGDPARMRALLPEGERFGGAVWGPGTVHVDAMDNEGNTAAFTPSGAWIMQSEVIPALGFPLSVRLSNCCLGPPSHPNLVAPFRRPRTTISPTLVIKDEQPWLAFGSMGGDQQDQWQLQFFLNRIVFDMPLQHAIEAPKFSSEHFPGFFYPHDSVLNRLRIEESVGEKTLLGLSARGHDLDVAPAWTEGFLCVTERNPETGVLAAGVDPRGTKSEVFPACALAY